MIQKKFEKQKGTRGRGRIVRRRIVTRAAALLLAASMLTGCTMPSGGGWDVIRALGDFLDLSKSSEEIGQTAFAETEEPAAESGETGDSGADTESASNDASDKFRFSLDDLGGSGDYSDYLSSGESLFRNQADRFYYYEQISTEEQALYDALWEIVQDPTSTEYRKGVEVSMDPSSDEFTLAISRAYEALIYDHPELFWFRQNGGNFSYYYSISGAVTGSYTVMLQLSKSYDNYEAEMTAFNQAVDAFLAEIDLNQSQAVIALQIHDRLIDLVTYDDTLAEQLSSSDDSYDYGYSAYGALVANSRGEAHTAVCDGYSYAYEYLLQQAGIFATRVGGYAGSDRDSLQPHSWNLVCLDGEWYEVDPTWDDQDPNQETESSIVSAAVADLTYWRRIRHFMFNLTTESISNFTPDDSYTYYTAEGYVTFLTASVHIRNTESDAVTTQDYLSYLAPIAIGTAHTYDALKEYSTTGTYSAAGLSGSTDAYSINADFDSDSDLYGNTGDGIVGEQELILYDADGDGIADDPSYQDLDADGWVDW